MSVSSRRVRRFPAAALVGAALAAAAACGRTGLDADEGSDLDGALLEPDATPPEKPEIDAQPSACVPTEEVCNGVDDDCDGQVDELPAIPCPKGGERYCVAGAWSACPQPCDTCMPGSERICFHSFCKYWAVQTCAADGKSFGKCKEAEPPPECASVAKTEKYSKALEQCCLDNGYCCLDEFDLDGDGSTSEMIGQCEEVQCKP
jgi:hypothetical protein